MSLEPDPRRATELGDMVMLYMFSRSGKFCGDSSTWDFFYPSRRIPVLSDPDSGTRVTFYGFCKRPLNLKMGLKCHFEL